MNLLEQNWQKIKERVITPLWHRRFKSMYESVKLDYDDFESLAGVELSKAIQSYDPDKSNIFTFATGVIVKKATTELRDCTQRDKRKALHVAESIYSVNEDGSSILDIIEGDAFNCKSPKDGFSDKMITYLKRLSRLQRNVLFALANGYSNDEIMKRLGISAKELSDAHATLKAYRNVSVLY